MDSISVKIPVTIKTKLTEKVRATRVQEITTRLQQVDLELQQINIQEKRAVEETAKENLQELQMIHQHFGVERQKRMEFKQQGEAKVEELNKLALGAELVDGTLERIAEIKVGDNMRELLNVEVLVEDDKIVAIRS
jgi:hypothetical protein